MLRELKVVLVRSGEVTQYYNWSVSDLKVVLREVGGGGVASCRKVARGLLTVLFCPTYLA